MQKKVIEMSCYIAGAGAFGVFLRWMQDQLAFNDAGLPEKSAFHVLLPLYLLVAALVFRRFVRQYEAASLSLPEDFSAAFTNPGRLFAALRWAIGGLMLLGGLMTLMTTELDRNADMLRVLAILAMLAGPAFSLLLTLADREKVRPNLPCLLAAVPLLLYAFWLVYCYRSNSINGVAWSYLVEVVTVCVALLAFFRVAGYPFGAPNWKRCMFDLCMGATLCLTSLADERYLGMQVILLATALMFLYYNWLMVCNFRESSQEPPVVEAKGDGFDRL